MENKKKHSRLPMQVLLFFFFGGGGISGLRWDLALCSAVILGVGVYD